VVKILLEERADVNAQNEFGSTPLTLAAEKGDTRTVSLLLCGKADPNLVGEGGGKPALVWAASTGATKVVNLLLQYRADVHATAAGEGKAAKGSSSAVLAAAKAGHVAVLRCLIGSKASLKNRDRRGDTPFLIAARHGRSDVLCLLAGLKADVEARSKTKQKESALEAASGIGCTNVVMTLLRLGTNVDGDPRDATTPLICAAENGQLESLSVLLSAKADLERRESSKGRTALLVAVRRNMSEAAYMLMMAGASHEVGLCHPPFDFDTAL